MTKLAIFVNDSPKEFDLSYLGFSTWSKMSRSNFMSPKRMPSQNHWEITSIKIATTVVCWSLSQIKVF